MSKAKSKKTVQKAANKIVEDKTFGLKNKNKSKKVQQFVKSVQTQAQHNVQQTRQPRRNPEEIAMQKMREAKAEQARMQKELQALYRSTIRQPPVPAGVDPKSVLCEFFKQGVCDKGDKCKFGHDLTLSKKSAKISLHADRRDGEVDKKDDSMANWDHEKLESVVKSKQGKQQNRTEIVCKYFLDAIEKEIYGWFWTCPNGGDNCMYRHALPPGYVFKSKKQRELEAQAAAEEKSDADITEEIEELRAALPPGGTPVTEASFLAWKKKRDEKRAAEIKAKIEEDNKRQGSNKENKGISGRALFTFDPSLFVDDADADVSAYKRPDEEEGQEKQESAEVADAGAFLDEEDDDLEGLEDLAIED